MVTTSLIYLFLKIFKMLYPKDRRDGRAVECTGLENQQTFAGFQGSNPCLSASFQLLKLEYNNVLSSSLIGYLSDGMN